MMSKNKKCFVISPIDTEYSDIRTHSDDVFKCIIEPALKRFEVTAVRADHMDEPGKITQQMISAILEYDLCIAILTGHNPNVFYELAVAQAARRPVVLMILKGETVPFDVKDYRVVEYNLEPQEVFHGTWIERLASHISGVLSDNYKPPQLLTNTSVEPRKKIVFYAPTLKGNPFFYEILDHIIEITSSDHSKIDVVVRKAVTTINYHMTSDHLRVLEEYIDNDYENTVLIMIPAGPHSYNEILNLDANSKINLIALDMEVDPDDTRLQLCSFLKQVILVDNKKGAELAATAVIDFCQTEKLDCVNAIICEGEFHNRGRYFREFLQQTASERGINVRFLDKPDELCSFAKASSASKHVIKTIKANLDAAQNRTTFIFCASDNLALGARIALSSAQLQLDGSTDLKIISFDASDAMRKLLDLEDRYMFTSIDQKYYEYAQRAVRFAKDIFEARAFDGKITYIIPKMYSGTSG